MARLALLGGGGFRVPLVYRALLGAARDIGIDEVALHDVDATRLEVIERVLERLAEGSPGAPRVRVTTDLDDALTGARFVFAAVRVGGLAGRTRDERVPLAEGAIGQETVGPGGICYGLRTVPVMAGIAERIAAVCPDAWVVNFTNPAGMVTEAMSRTLGDRVLGVCDSPAGLVRRAVHALGVDPSRASADYFGLNHLGWLRALRVDGRDLLPDLLADQQRLASFEEGRLFGATWLRALGMIPNEYLVYFYRRDETVRALHAATHTRGEQLRDQQARFYAEAADPRGDALALWEATRREREESYFAEHRPEGEGRDAADVSAGGYEGVAVRLLAALAADRPTRLVLDVRNQGALACLDDDAVVEVPCVVDQAGARPLAIGTVPGHAAALLQAVKSVERDTVAAALSRDRTLALRALGTHPLVGSVDAAVRILEAYEAEDRELAWRFEEAAPGNE